ncbi:MAG: hypothetical protein M0R74_11020, partial [Dehalococcoidia bacterium]|nr:hypothetical protein [Dehalococcoidia bacterium]
MSVPVEDPESKTTGVEKLSPSQSILKSVFESGDRLKVDPEVLDLLRTSWREMRTQLPVRMDNRKLQIFEGYR